MPGFEMLREIGMDNVARHIKNLTQSFLRRTQELGILAKTPADSAGPLVVLQSKDATLLVQKLFENEIVASNRHDGLRISFQVYNTFDDVKAVIEVLTKNLNLMVLDPAGVGSYD
jgi:Selenocysteine lyase